MKRYLSVFALALSLILCVALPTQAQNPYPQFDKVFSWQPPVVVFDRQPMFDVSDPPKDASERIYWRPFGLYEDETGTIKSESSDAIRQAVIEARSLTLLEIGVPFADSPSRWYCEKSPNGTLSRVLVQGDWSVNVVNPGLVPISLMDTDWSKRGLPWQLRPSAQIIPAFTAQAEKAKTARYDPVKKTLKK